ncbi:hypothetical protein WF022_003850 [Salmonella enterica]|nr:hypothetical protein [Salmonella enterica]EKG5783894.1 hypothetical protein [Salmonella enterica]
MMNVSQGLKGSQPGELDDTFNQAYSLIFNKSFSSGRLPKELIYLINNVTLRIENIVAAGPCYATGGYKFFVLTNKEIYLAKVGFCGKKKRIILLSDIKSVKDGKNSMGFKALEISFPHAKHIFEIFIKPNDAAQRLLAVLTSNYQVNNKTSNEASLIVASTENIKSEFPENKSVDTDNNKISKMGLFAALKKRHEYIEELSYLQDDKILTSKESDCVKKWILSGTNAISFDFDDKIDNFNCLKDSLESLDSLLKEKQINKNDFNEEKANILKAFSIEIE